MSFIGKVVRTLSGNIDSSTGQKKPVNEIDSETELNTHLRSNDGSPWSGGPELVRSPSLSDEAKDLELGQPRGKAIDDDAELTRYKVRLMPNVESDAFRWMMKKRGTVQQVQWELVLPADPLSEAGPLAISRLVLDLQHNEATLEALFTIDGEGCYPKMKLNEAGNGASYTIVHKEWRIEVFIDPDISSRKASDSAAHKAFEYSLRVNGKPLRLQYGFSSN
eukprot:TRINITY_DN19723_c0_g1_i1.p1 TRINITY_DN19723_c0_g1~~TRINITY_DN19723_c0_g1_i1.p1  ORF type:complete len:221 (-),score=47.16 TRINITY_DN19723_c0_g1_i1:103-765(-)